MNNTTGEQDLIQLKAKIEQEQRELDLAKQEHKRQQADADRKKVDFDHKQSDTDRAKNAYEESKATADQILVKIQKLEQQRERYHSEFESLQRNLADLMNKK